ncbi:hypothetical protein Glove_83g103 [Diversispora epigaea]|uniref:Uncharacterized protein n=1 Tax=Diversispora epigaea TaxID=1348612 RepID=A0A397JED9_9GLOM|nr:hypothetical protein Glove_83g103 [Diversispora epigaea]
MTKQIDWLKLCEDKDLDIVGLLKPEQRKKIANIYLKQHNQRNEEVEEMETSDAENEETNVEKLKLKFNNEETDKKMEETFNYIYETVNHC